MSRPPRVGCRRHGSTSPQSLALCSKGWDCRRHRAVSCPPKPRLSRYRRTMFPGAGCGCHSSACLWHEKCCVRVLRHSQLPCDNADRSLGSRGADTVPHGLERHLVPQDSRILSLLYCGNGAKRCAHLVLHSAHIPVSEIPQA